MNKWPYILILLLLGLGLSSGCRKPPEAPVAETSAAPTTAAPLARLHFVGVQFLAANTNAAKLNAIRALPETQILGELIASKMVAALDAFWFPNAAKVSPADPASLYRPLLDDLLKAESFLEVRGTGQTPDWILALRLAPDRLTAARSNLAALAMARLGRQPTALTIEGHPGWEAKGSEAGRSWRWLESGPWLVMNWGPAASVALNEAATRIKSSGRPFAAAAQDWLEGEGNAAWLAQTLGLPDWLKGPPGQWPQTVHLTVEGKGENVRTKMRLSYAQPLRLALEPWKIPTHTIRDDLLVSFTAAQPVGLWLSGMDWVKTFDLKSAPNQIFVWALGDIPFATYAALPAKQVTNLVARTAAHFPDFLKRFYPNPKTGEVFWQSNRAEVIWRGLPIVIPFVRAESEPAGDFLLGGLFPTAPSTNPPPPQLLSQIQGRTNLLYYDWEITQARLAQWGSISQVLDLVRMDLRGQTNTEPVNLQAFPGARWMSAVGKLLGETVTEITATSPRELTLVRKSHLGLAGVEILALARWIESPSFPSLKPPAPAKP